MNQNSNYELTVLFNPDLESDIETPLSTLRSLITTHGGTITTEENLGKKKLAYRVKKQDFAVYVALEVALPADAPLKISNTLNITDGVLRYLLVTVDEKGRRLIAEAAAKRPASSEREDDTTDGDYRRSRRD